MPAIRFCGTLDHAGGSSLVVFSSAFLMYGMSFWLYIERTSHLLLLTINKATSLNTTSRVNDRSVKPSDTPQDSVAMRWFASLCCVLQDRPQIRKITKKTMSMRAEISST